MLHSATVPFKEVEKLSEEDAKSIGLTEVYSGTKPPVSDSHSAAYRLIIKKSKKDAQGIPSSSYHYYDWGGTRWIPIVYSDPLPAAGLRVGEQWPKQSAWTVISITVHTI